MIGNCNLIIIIYSIKSPGVMASPPFTCTFSDSGSHNNFSYLVSSWTKRLDNMSLSSGVEISSTINPERDKYSIWMKIMFWPDHPKLYNTGLIRSYNQRPWRALKFQKILLFRRTPANRWISSTGNLGAARLTSPQLLDNHPRSPHKEKWTGLSELSAIGYRIKLPQNLEMLCKLMSPSPPWQPLIIIWASGEMTLNELLVIY